MPVSQFGRALAIVNPAAQNGNGAKGAAFLKYASTAANAPFASLDVVATKYSGHAVTLAKEAAAYDVVLALGGDGVIHEVVNGLMRIPREDRPVLAVLPCGNGNDYARTLGMSFDFQEAFDQLASAQVKRVDVGECNGRYFAETLSFGLDAAIAIGTHERRKRTGKTGTRLFFEEGIDQLVNHRDAYAYKLTEDSDQFSEGSMLLFAVQVGATYGGGFKVCPDADPSDGLFDLCVAKAPLGLVKAAYLFLKAKDGGHVSYTDSIQLSRASRVRIEFDAAPPAQIDGESFTGATVFDISLHEGALDVLFA